METFKYEILSNVSESLNDLMNENKIGSISELAEDMHFSRTILYDIKNKTNFFDIKTAIKIANYFEVSLDYLFGLSDIKEKIFGEYDNQFYIRLLSELKKQRTSFYRMCEDLGFSQNIKSYWKQGSLPQTDKLVKIAKYLSVSVDYLVGRTKN